MANVTETNREPNITVDELEAIQSITDASGSVHTNALADRDGDDLTPNTVDVSTSITDAVGTTVTDFGDLGGRVKYAQTTAPTSPASGETWYDTSSGIFRVYADLGSGLAWHSIPPVQVLEEVSTFAESDVTVTRNNTKISSGSVRLLNIDVISDFEDGNITTTSSDWDGWGGDTGNFSAQQSTVISGSYTGELTADNANVAVTTDRGADITGNLQISIRSDNNSGNASDAVRIEPFTSGEIDLLGYMIWDGDGGTVTFEGSTVLNSWSANTTYDVIFDWDFANDQVDIFINGTNEGTFNLANSVSGWGFVEYRNITSGGAITRNAYIDGVGVPNKKTSGDALVEWDSAVPADIKSYDLAARQLTLDGETATVDVEDAAGNVLFSDIGQNFDISTIDPTKEVKLRANLSRADTANNPTVDYLARRFTR